MPHQCTNCGRAFADGSKEMLSGCPDCGGNKFQFSPDGFEDEAPPDQPPEPPDRPDDGVAGTVGSAAATVRDIVSGSAGPDATSANPPSDSPSTGVGVASDADASSTATRRPESPSNSTSSPTAPASTATADTDADDDIIVAESTPLEDEDAAQADARSDLVEPDDLPDSADSDPTVETDTDSVEVTDESGDPAETPETPETDAPPTDAADPATERTVADEPDAESEPDRTVADEPDTEAADRPDLSQLRQELNDQFESIRIVDRGQYELNLMELYDRDEVIIALQEDGRYSIRVPEVIGEIDR